MVTTAQENYLKIIFHILEEQPAATTSGIAGHLNISPASVSEKIKQLAKDRLVLYEPYKGVTLTKAGKKYAVSAIRRHRISERFLYDMVGIDWKHVHAEAKRMESGISDRVGRRLYTLLKNPKTCPHGNPVPDEKGRISEPASHPLHTLKKGDSAIVRKITHEDPNLLTYLATLGLMPEVKISVEEKAVMNGPVIVRIGNATYALGASVVRNIWVSLA